MDTVLTVFFIISLGNDIEGNYFESKVDEAFLISWFKRYIYCIYMAVYIQNMT